VGRGTAALVSGGALCIALFLSVVDGPHRLTVEAFQPPETMKMKLFLDDPATSGARGAAASLKVPRWPGRAAVPPVDDPRALYRVRATRDAALLTQDPGEIPRERGPLGVLLALPVMAPLLFTLCRGMVSVLRSNSPTAPAPGGPAPPTTDDVPRMPWRPEGWAFWQWNAHGGPHEIHYVAAKPPSHGQTTRKAPILLVHGFGASAHHWRHNVPALAAAGHPVYALDLLGFGLSQKPVIEYHADIWRDQIADFISEVVDEPCIVVGNSLGGYAVLNAAAQYPHLCKAVVLLNAAGRFESDIPADDTLEEDEEPSALDTVLLGMRQLFMKTVIKGSFFVTKHPARIRSVLNTVYIDRTNVDDELVESIEYAARASNAPEVFYRVIHRNWRPNSQSTMDALLAKLTHAPRPLLLLWGERDPWIRPQAGNAIQRLYPAAERVSLDAGHCPHDEVPALVNAALLAWLERQRL